MRRALLLTTILLGVPCAVFSQPLSVLHIKVALVDTEQRTTPVPHHALLISDSPPTTAPRRIITAMDGTADVRLRPGTYIVESDRPVALDRMAYQWTQTVDIVAGRDAVLELTAKNAEIDPIAFGATSTAAALETDPSMLVLPWQDSVVALWTPTAHASGFLIDAVGLIATDRRSIGTSTSVEVQLAPAVKVMGRVLVADPVRDVAIVWIEPAAIASRRPVLLGCALPERPPLEDGQNIFTLASPLREQSGLTSGVVTRVEPRSTMSDFLLAEGSAGGPVFAASGALVGLTSGVDEDGRREQFRVVGIDAVCSVVPAAEAKMKAAMPPSGSHLPVEPVRPFPVSALKDEAKRRAGGLSAYLTSSSDFDVALMTPVMIYAAHQKPDETSGRGGRGGAGDKERTQPALRALSDFSNWSSYVADVPPVLLIRATPKLVEGFWTTVARGAALTQGVALPSMKHFKPGFSRMRAFCGDTEVTPIHPFTLEQRVSESDAMYEGLYVFDPSALGPHCGTVKLVLYSEKEPEKGDTRVVDAKIIQQIWQDFAPYRAPE